MEATTGELALASVGFHSIPEGRLNTERWKGQLKASGVVNLGCYFSLPNSTTDQKRLLLYKVHTQQAQR